ncbi:hypothetical protein [Pseudorhodoferax soli]|uniref:Uncharacterized protein n=1 Tax=Pseudorhodoferax soli TaxID=545864 RepID=A0A368XC89_9BURK|nr:hypothetical protein [Pseudorhodoferax soli]RCW63644.1 hypothetical protein DES41_11840 [Pseudorhodoferax soli]
MGPSGTEGDAQACGAGNADARWPEAPRDTQPFRDGAHDWSATEREGLRFERIALVWIFLSGLTAMAGAALAVSVSFAFE